MARLVYAKDDKIMVSPENIPTKEDTVAVDSIEALKDYKLIYETKESKENARVIMGSTTGIPTEDDDTIYEAKKESEDEDTGSQTPDTTTPSETPASPEGDGDGDTVEESGNEPDAPTDEVEEVE